MGRKLVSGGSAPFLGRERGPQVKWLSRLGRGPPPYQVACCSIQPFGHNRYGPKIGGLRPLWGGGAGSPSNTMWSGPRPTCIPSVIFIRPTVWPQYTNVTDRQRSDSIGRTILQTVAQLEELGQCIPPQRHVLPVSQSGESLWMDVC